MKSITFIILLHSIRRKKHDFNCFFFLKKIALWWTFSQALKTCSQFFYKFFKNNNLRNTFSSERDCFHYLLFERYNIFGKYLSDKYVKIHPKIQQVASVHKFFFGEHAPDGAACRVTPRKRDA